MGPIRRAGRRARGEDGAAAVEFALIAGVLVSLVFGILEFGRMYSHYEVLQGAAREGARVAAVRGTADEIVAAVEQASAGFTVGPGTPTADRVCDQETQGEHVTVSWAQDFSVDVPFLPPMTKTVTVQGVFRCE